MAKRTNWRMMKCHQDSGALAMVSSGGIYGSCAGLVVGALADALATRRGFVPPIDPVLWFLVPGLITCAVVGFVLGGYSDWFQVRLPQPAPTPPGSCISPSPPPF
jgi:hypothetical protein